MDSATQAAGAGMSERAPEEIWADVFEQVRQSVDVPTVWLAMQAVTPLAMEGNFFVAALPPARQYLALNLQSHEYAAAIEEALQKVTGRILAFHLIQGESLADWEEEKRRNPERYQPQAAAPPEAAAPSAETKPARPLSNRTIYQTWEDLNEFVTHAYKQAPLMKYPHGQALYLIECAQAISDTMDILMPPPGQPRDDAQERQLAKTIERLGGVIKLDPLFISLEILRYRQMRGIDIDISN